MSIKIVPAYDKKQEVKALFSEYTQMIIEQDESFREYLSLQNYDDETEHLEMKYGMPDGRIYLLYCEDSPAGCIAMKKIDSQNCEMKRLYIRPEFRGRKLGELLVRKVIEQAKEIGYNSILLDTFPYLNKAICLYKKLGFYEIERYNDNPIDTSIYMKLDL